MGEMIDKRFGKGENTKKQNKVIYPSAHSFSSAPIFFYPFLFPECIRAIICAKRVAHC